MSVSRLTHVDTSASATCPYCRRPLRWTAMRWLARGVFECERCGEFPDFRPAAPGREPRASVDGVTADSDAAPVLTLV